MPTPQEVYETMTKPPEPGAFERQQVRQVRTARNRRLGAFALAAAIAAVAIVLIAVTRADVDEGVPVGEPTASVVDAAEAAALAIVTDFHAAYAAHDADRALSYLAEDADLKAFIGAPVSGRDREGFRLQLAWDEATGTQETLGPCEVGTTSPTGITSVGCSYTWDGLRSDEVGLGPYRGSTVYLVRDGAIVGTGARTMNTERFSPEMWEPLAEWVSTTYPDDAAIMYNANVNNYVLTDESIRLWERRTKEYAEVVNQGDVGP